MPNKIPVRMQSKYGRDLKKFIKFKNSFLVETQNFASHIFKFYLTIFSFEFTKFHSAIKIKATIEPHTAPAITSNG